MGFMEKLYNGIFGPGATRTSWSRQDVLKEAETIRRIEKESPYETPRIDRLRTGYKLRQETAFGIAVVKELNREVTEYLGSLAKGSK